MLGCLMGSNVVAERVVRALCHFGGAETEMKFQIIEE